MTHDNVERSLSATELHSYTPLREHPGRSLFDLTFAEIQAFLREWGEAAFRATQIWEALYRRLADSYDAMSSLPRALRQRLAAEYALGRLSPRVDRLSSDGWTRKILFDLADGKQIETVLMGYATRRTVCISTQAGCAMGCPFCATGQGGLQRNLAAGEIVEQVLFFERQLRKDEPPLLRGEGGCGGRRDEKGGMREAGSREQEARATRYEAKRRRQEAGRGGSRTDALLHYPTNKLTNIVFMGMGEPFANYQATIEALRRLTDPAGWNFGARRITVSTVGLIPGIEKFTRDGGQVNLAVSIHAATDELRDRLAPINKRYPLRDLIEAVRAYAQATRRRVSFEWALIDHVNDTVEQARALAGLARRVPAGLAHVNLIPLNPTRGYGGSASRRERIAAFRAELERRGIPNTLRVRRGIDINAGCGQLRQTNVDANEGR